MTANNNFVLREILDDAMLIPISEESNHIRGIIRLSSTGAFLWKALASEQSIESLAAALVESYDIDAETAFADVKAFIDSMMSYGCICQ